MRIVNKSDVKEHLQELLAVQITEDMRKKYWHKQYYSI